MKKSDAKRKTRITVDLTPNAYDRLGKLEFLVGASSKADIIRQALQLYEEVVKRAISGEKIFVRKPASNVERELLVIGAGLRKVV